MPTVPEASRTSYCLVVAIVIFSEGFRRIRGDEYDQRTSLCSQYTYGCSYSQGYTYYYSSMRQTSRQTCNWIGWSCWNVYRAYYVPVAQSAYRKQCRKCNIDCQVGSWSDWSSCDGSCHDTTMEWRYRSVLRPQYGNGADCPILKESRRCYTDSKACKINGTCYAHLQRRSLAGDNGCQECNRLVSRDTWTFVSNGSRCDDNQVCTRDDQCDAAGVCSGTPISCCEVVNNQTASYHRKLDLKSGYCLIDSQCYRDNVSNSDSQYSQCQVCDPDQFVFQWTTREGISCNDANLCTFSDKCTSTGLCVGIALPGQCRLATLDDVSPNWDRLSCSNDDSCVYHLDPVNGSSPQCPDNTITIPDNECSFVCQACDDTSIVCTTIRGGGCLPQSTTCGCTVVMWDVCFNDSNARNHLHHPCQYCHLSRNYRSLILYAAGMETDASGSCTRNDPCGGGSVSCIGDVGSSVNPVPAPLMVIPSTGTCKQ
ncbi:protein psiQ-like [Oscarella lobularis]|uniref:protein psiQ-like n=1 Tax=Oscarella lobularis TaxID=121494 RepID=UPI003313E3A3